MSSKFAYNTVIRQGYIDKSARKAMKDYCVISLCNYYCLFG